MYRIHSAPGSIDYLVSLEMSPERCPVSCRIGVHPGTVLREDVAVYHKGGRPQLPQMLPGEFGNQGRLLWMTGEMNGRPRVRL